MKPDFAFFCISNEQHFLGLAALVNSLWDVGHHERIYVTDCGLSEAQRQSLPGHVTLIPAPSGYAPTLLKTYGPLAIDPDVAILLDADVIVLRPMTELIRDKAIFFRDPLSERFHPEWSRLGFCPLRPKPYVSAGHVVIPRSSGLMPFWRDATERLLEVVRADPSSCLTPSDPFFLSEQDALNALLCSIEPERYLIVDEVAYWPFERSPDRARLLHHILDKPWQTALRSTPYSRQMTRLLAAGPVRVPQQEIPPWLRDGLVGDLSRQSRSARHTMRSLLRGRLGIRERLSHPTLPKNHPLASTVDTRGSGSP